ncbi:putative D,D-dipeptide transport system permease protein DdpC [Pseudobythopirellula maris]|uniref:Putative D,D-dipeptide transport system permease protein DdpC n=1 Tax=Pseudobythopirellula maris TaxID=2527991 RepID=A0A5C5ZVC2_9BACT|nr:ABC transporter permease [Pseudobythopirellula maris]TWT91126.1 putative D,D-dipeptide transport system permease protein DdpC [Pseudobythopirellula maris]
MSDPNNPPEERPAERAELHAEASAVQAQPTTVSPEASLSAISTRPSAGFWGEAWRKFRQRRLAVVALLFVLLLVVVALFSPAIAGTKPVVAYYKGGYYFPAMGYFNPRWENPVFQKDRFRKRYSDAKFKEKDPESWAIWPLVYQDPYRRVMDDEWPGRPGNPFGAEGKPSSLNLFGTDQQGVDVFAQMVHGSRTALVVGFVSMGIASIVGVVVGALAGYFGGWADILLSRVIELVLCIPALVLILALLAIVDKATIWHIMAVIGLTRWTGIARLARAEFMKLKEMDFVTAARAIGASRPRIIFRHVLRNALAPILVPITFGIASAILLESGLSFLGFGPPPPNPSWGALLQAGRATIQQTWWLIFFPGAAIFLTVLAYNLIGEGLQESTDPRLKQSD